MDEWLDRVIC